jgi:ABC-type multidrug transport system fused ATPase/permease subunit
MLSDWWLQRWALQPSVEQPEARNLHIFLALTLGTTLVALLRSVAFFTSTNRANSTIHQRALRRVLLSPMHFFTSNPLGRVLNRFAADLGQVDELLPAAAFDTLQLGTQAVGTLAIVCWALPWLCLYIPFLFWYLYHIRAFVTKSLRELKRLEGIAKSPVYSSFTSNLAGVKYIRWYMWGVLRMVWERFCSCSRQEQVEEG